MAVDADFAKVVLLAQFLGEDGSTTFIDDSTYARTMTAVGTAQIDTAISKFGGSSGLFPTAASGVTVPYTSSLQLGTSDVDIACWVYPTTNATTMDFIGHRSTSNTADFWFLRRNAGGVVRALFRTANVNFIDISSTGVIALNTWSYVQVTRIGTAFKLYINGTLEASGTSASSMTSPSVPLWIGAGDNTGAGGLIGQLDDVRITVAGSARSTSVPTDAFPTGQYEVSGSVLDSGGSPTSRTIRMYRRDTGVFLRSATSASGSYSMATPYSGEVNVVCLDDVSGTTENDLILRTTPV